MIGKPSDEELEAILETLPLEFSVLDKDDKVSLTEGQVEYITKFHDVAPQILTRVVRINPLLG